MSSYIVGTLTSMISLSVMLLIAAEGEIFVERSGQFNMGIEGIMISAALSAFAATYFSKSLFIGFLVGAVAGAILGVLIFLLIQGLHLSGILVAVIFNLMASGVTGFLAEMTVKRSTSPLLCKELASIQIPVLSRIPYIGEILFDQNIVVYLSFLAVPFISYYLFQTKSGLEIRAVGEDEVAAQSMGISVFRTKMKCFLFGGITAGIAGAYCSLTIGLFMDGMTENKGFIAMALCAFSGRYPVACLFGALFFALVDAIQIRVQLFNTMVPYEFLLCLPYALTIFALLFTSDQFKGKKPVKIIKIKKAKETAEEKEEPDYFI